jgi:DNA polymerase IIIc chi subunit
MVAKKLWEFAAGLLRDGNPIAFAASKDQSSIVAKNLWEFAARLLRDGNPIAFAASKDQSSMLAKNLWEFAARRHDWREPHPQRRTDPRAHASPLSIEQL